MSESGYNYEILAITRLLDQIGSALREDVNWHLSMSSGDEGLIMASQYR